MLTKSSLKLKRFWSSNYEKNKKKKKRVQIITQIIVYAVGGALGLSLQIIIYKFFDINVANSRVPSKPKIDLLSFVLLAKYTRFLFDFLINLRIFIILTSSRALSKALLMSQFKKAKSQTESAELVGSVICKGDYKTIWFSGILT